MMSSNQSTADFCGRSQFWDLNLTWYNSYPGFTECFQDTVLLLAPCVWLWLLAPLYLLSLYNSERKPEIIIGRLNITKCILSGFLIITSVCVSVKSIVDHNTVFDTSAQADVISPFIRAATMLFNIFLIRQTARKGEITSGYLFIFWLLEIITGIIPFYTNIIEKEYNDEIFRFVVFYVDFAFVIITFILHCFAEKIEIPLVNGKKPCPQLQASFLNQIIFYWVLPLVITGYRRPLVETDVADLTPLDKSKQIVPRFQIAWAQQVQKYGLRKRPEKSQKKVESTKLNYQSISGHYSNTKLSHDGKTDERSPLLGKKVSGTRFHDNIEERASLLGNDVDNNTSVKVITKTSLKKKKSASVIRALMKTFGWEVVQASSYKMVYDVLLFVNPMLLSVLINYVDNSAKEFAWKGYLYATLMFVATIGQSMFFHRCQYQVLRVGMRIRTALISAIYRKALRMSNLARNESTVGEIVNLMSVDSQKFLDFMGYIWSLWSGPFQIIFAMVFLYVMVGYSVFAGVGVLCVVVPINLFVLYRMQILQEVQMKQKDRRIKLISEVLNGIKVLKLYAWEESFKEKIADLRQQELDTIRKIYKINAISVASWTIAPYAVTLATFGTYVYTNDAHFLGPDVAFVAINLFNILRFSINLFPIIISDLARARVSLKRIHNFLTHEDLDENNVQHSQDEVDAVVMENASFQWDPELGPCLKNINCHVMEGELVAVVGQVGAGKSSLISALLGDIQKTSGRVNVKGRVAYVPQEAWIQNATLHDNILFGKDKVDATYNAVLDACALRPDLAILAGGDKTEIGEKGINLSGGQKQRVSLGRAVYNDADIYLLDDPLSAVDAHVGKHIFEQVISDKGILKSKTRILVTHGVHWLPNVDKIIVMVDGEISESGSYEELMTHDGAFAQFLRTYLQDHRDEEEEKDSDEEAHVLRERMLERLLSVHTDTATSGDEHDTLRRRKRGISSGLSLTSDDDKISRQASADPHYLRRSLSLTKSRHLEASLSVSQSSTLIVKDAATKIENIETLIEEELAETGKVKWSVYFTYIRAFGSFIGLALILVYAGYTFGYMASNMWLSSWTDNAVLANKSLSPDSIERRELNDYYLGIYGMFGAIQAVCVMIFAIGMAYRMVVASKVLHSRMLSNILRSPMSFFDTTPMGRIINRFSKDIDSVDEDLPNLFFMWFDCIFFTLSAIAVIIYSTPIFAAVAVGLAIVYFFIQRVYVTTSRQLKRLESKSRSPIFNLFGETLQGVSVIRAYRQEERFIQENERCVDVNIAYFYYALAANRWLGVTSEFMGNIAILAAAMFAVIARDTITGGILGLSISYALEMTSALTWAVRMTSDLETNIVSVERIKEYTETPTEAEWHIPDKKPPLDWPDKGEVKFENYTTRYRPGLDLVLHGIDIQVASGEKVGIVGRTGAGKSSMTLALFRIIEAAGGRIVIDDRVAADMGLHDLRSKLTILPQDPVLFSGPLRMNLDPFDRYTDGELWRSLEQAHMKTFIEGLPEGLLHECGEGGQNLSVGQRQLICLARTLLHKTKILVLDEATAAVDMETDDLIQETIRTEFKECTILTIAHRLNTIMDYDRVMVLDQGLVCEFDTPSNLLQRKDSVFYSLAKNARLV